MNLKEIILNDRLIAMKARDNETNLILSTLIGELDRLDKNPSYDLIIRTIKKIIEENTMHNINPFETELLSKYLPKMLSDVELIEIINKQITDNSYSTIKDMGKIMKFLSENHSGQYNGQTASNIIKSVLIK